MWWYMPVILAFRKLRQKDHQVWKQPSYITRPYLKTSNKQANKQKHSNSSNYQQMMAKPNVLNLD